MGAAFNDLAASPLHLLHRVSQCAASIFDAQMAAARCDLTPRQLTVLMAIEANEGTDQTTLVRMTGVDRSTLADLMRRLLAKRLVQRRRSRRDARAYEVVLTDKGRELLRQAKPGLQAVERQIEKALPAASRKEFLAALQSIVAVIGGTSAEDAPA